MDPTAALANALTFLAEQRKDESVEALRALADWIERGGYFPGVREATEAY
jgi:hypothetical protein